MASEAGEKGGEIINEAKKKNVEEKREWLAVPNACKIWDKNREGNSEFLNTGSKLKKRNARTGGLWETVKEWWLRTTSIFFFFLRFV